MIGHVQGVSDATIAEREAALRRSLGEHWGRFVVEGAVMVAIGIAALILPNVATLTVTLLAGWILFAIGVFGAVGAFSRKGAPGFLYSLVLALLTGLLGLALVAQPFAGVLTLTLALVAYFIAHGIGMLLMARSMRAGTRVGWLVTSAVIDFILAALVIMGWPETAAWLIGLLLGINLLFAGLALIFAALGARADAQ